MRPVLAGMCKYESLKDCSLDMYDLHMMNLALDIQNENDNRVQAANQPPSR